MSLKKSIIETFRRNVEKQTPWQPYQGPGGGQGWQNMVTGEIRYQENRPDPGEGMPDDHEGGVPEGYEDAEQYEDAEEIDDWHEPDIEDWAEEYDGVTDIEVEIDGEIREGNPVDVDEESGTVEMIDHETFDTYHVAPEEIETHPLELEPELGWGEGWTDAPSEPSDLETDQEVELYDFNQNEWVTGEVRQVDDWGGGEMYVDIYDEETGNVYEFLDGEPSGGTDALITAQEDLFRPEVVEDFDPMETDFEAGDEVVLFDEPTGEFFEGEVDYVDGYGMTVETEGGSDFKVESDNRFTPLTEEGMMEYELEEIDTLEEPALLPDGPDELAEFADEIVQAEHPTEGSVMGEVSVIDHDEKGEHLYIGDTEVGIPLDDPDHPLAQMQVDAVENPYNDFDDEFIPFLDNGDELVISDGNDYWSASVTGTVPDGSEVQVDGQWMDHEQLAEGYEGTDVVMTDSDLEPNPPDGFEWEEPEEAGDIHIGDEVWYDTVHTEVPTSAEVTEVTDGSVDHYAHVDVVDPQTGEEHEVQIENLQGHAPVSGGVPEAETGADYLNPGDGMEIAYRNENGGIETMEAMMLSEPGYNGEFSVRTQDGEVHRFNNSESGSTHSITEDGVDITPPEGADAASPAEVASRVEETLDLDHGVQILDQERKDELKGELFYHFDPDRVREFYDLQSEGGGAWKSTSGSQQAADYESAYARALGIDAPQRGEIKSGLNDGYASSELQEIAETAAELSQRHFEETFGDGYTLSRGTSPAGAHSLFASYLANPAASEYESPFLAINNFSTSRHTAERFEGDGAELGATVDWETSPDDVVAMHDYLFTEEGTHESEEEITLRGDMETIAAEDIELNAAGSGSGANFGKLPEEWTESEAQAFNKFAHKAGDKVLDQMEWTENGVNNALEIRDVLEDEHGVDTSSNGFFEEAEEAAEEMGVRRSGIDPSGDVEFDDGFEEFDAFEWDSSELEGETVRYTDEWGDEMESEVTMALGGASFETAMGDEVSVSQINEIQTGDKTTADDFDTPEFDAEALDGGDEVQWVGTEGIEGGPVSYVGDGGDFVYVEDGNAAGGVATVDADDIIEVPDEIAEGSGDDADPDAWADYDYYDGDLSTFDLEGETIQYYGGEAEVDEAVDAASVRLDNGDLIDGTDIDQVYEGSSEGSGISEWDTDLGNYVDESQIEGATPGDQITVTDDFVGDEMELEVVGEEDGVPLVNPTSDEYNWDSVPLHQHDDWTIESVQEGEPSPDGSDDTEVPDAGSFEPMQVTEAADLNDYTGEWIRMDPDPGQFPEGVVGRLDNAVDAGPGGTVDISEVETLGDEEFPMSSYTGPLDEVEGVPAADGDESDFNEDINDQLDDLGL